MSVDVVEYRNGNDKENGVGGLVTVADVVEPRIAIEEAADAALERHVTREAGELTDPSVSRWSDGALRIRGRRR